MVHRVQGQVLDPQISQRMQELGKGEASIDSGWLILLLNRQFLVHFPLYFGVVVVLLIGVGVELLLKLLGRQWRIDCLYLSPVSIVNEIRIELYGAIDDVVVSMSLHVFEIFDEVLAKEVDLIRIPVHFLGEGHAPHQGINALVMVVLGDGGAIEVQLEDHVVCFKHALEASLEDVAFFEVNGPCAFDDLQVESEGEAASEDKCPDRPDFLESVNH